MPEIPLNGAIPSKISPAKGPTLVYVLTTDCRDFYADMALVSMLSVGLSNPGITTVLLVDTISMGALQKYRHKLLKISDSIVTVDTPSGSALFRSRWLKTQVGQFVQGKVICLDVDTIVRSSIDWLNHFDSDFGAVADAPMLEAKQDTFNLLMSEKMGWNPKGTYYNSGFFYFVSSPAVTRFLRRGMGSGRTPKTPSIIKTSHPSTPPSPVPTSKSRNSLTPSIFKSPSPGRIASKAKSGTSGNQDEWVVTFWKN